MTCNTVSHPFFLSLFIIISTSGYTSPQTTLQLNAHIDDPMLWEKVVLEHTKRHQVYQLTDKKMDMRATLITPKLRTALIAARDRFHGKVTHELTMEIIALGQRPDEGLGDEHLSGPSGDEQITVLLSVYIPDQRYRALDSSYSIWDIQLTRAEAFVQPVSILRLRNDAALQELFPHIDRFDDIYILRFPLYDYRTGTIMLSPTPEALSLHLQSAAAEGQVTWNFVPDTKKPHLDDHHMSR